MRNKMQSGYLSPRRTLAGLLSASVLMFGIAMQGTAGAAEPVKNVVLVHGGFVDGGGWEPVFKLLKAKGYNVSVVQKSTASLAAHVATTKAVIDAQDGPVVLVGHSYGGAVITEAGNDAKVSRLVYIAAWTPDNGESV